MQVRDKYQEFAFRINLTMHLTNTIRQVEYTPTFGVDSMNLSFNSYCSLSLSLDCRLRIFTCSRSAIFKR